MGAAQVDLGAAQPGWWVLHVPTWVLARCVGWVTSRERLPRGEYPLFCTLLAVSRAGQQPARFARTSPARPSTLPPARLAPTPTPPHHHHDHLTRRLAPLCHPRPCLQKYEEMKMQATTVERHILRAFGFVVHVEHPHRFILNYCQMLMKPG